MGRETPRRGRQKQIRASIELKKDVGFLSPLSYVGQHDLLLVLDILFDSPLHASFWLLNHLVLHCDLLAVEVQRLNPWTLTFSLLINLVAVLEASFSLFRYLVILLLYLVVTDEVEYRPARARIAAVERN